MSRDLVNSSVTLVKGGETCKWSPVGGSWMMFVKELF